MKNSIIIFFLTAFHLSSFSQKIYSTKTDLAECKELIFYGYDFGHFKLAEAKRLNNADIAKYIPAWVGYLYTYKNEDYLKKKLNKKKVLFDFDYTTTVMKDLNNDNLISITKNIISPDSIQSIISNYQVKQQEGIGFVVIVECFEKVTKTSSAYFTFFDIATKKIIMSKYYETARAGGTGLTNFWGSGLNETFYYYLDEVYNKQLKAK